MKTLIIAAHPDDEVLGCGGTMAGLAGKGHEVFVAILGEGITGRYENREAADMSLLEPLQKRSREAGKLLGVREVFHYGLPDNRFDAVPVLDIVKILEKLIDDIGPEAVYTHSGGDLNIDHAIAFRATLTATRPLAGCPVRDLYSYEVPSSTEWAFGLLEPAFRPNVFVEITATLEAKVRAMQLYDGETRPFPHPRSPEALRTIARRWGTVVGCEAAEAFELIRSIA